MDPAFSPGSRRIAFAATTSVEGERVVDLWVMRADGSQRRQLTHLRRREAAVSPSWSPDGQQIAFTWLRADRHRKLSTAVELIGAAGRGRRRLVQGFLPDWSPDGKTLLYTRGDMNTGGGTYELCLTDARTGKVRRVLRKCAMMGAWSSEGGKIAFVAVEKGVMTGLFMMNADGSAVRRLGQADLALAPHWAADGRSGVFTDTDDWTPGGPGHAEIRIIDADGTNERVVTKEGDFNATGGGIILASVIVSG